MVFNAQHKKGLFHSLNETKHEEEVGSNYKIPVSNETVAEVIVNETNPTHLDFHIRFGDSKRGKNKTSMMKKQSFNDKYNYTFSIDHNNQNLSFTKTGLIKNFHNNINYAQRIKINLTERKVRESGLFNKIKHYRRSHKNNSLQKPFQNFQENIKSIENKKNPNIKRLNYWVFRIEPKTANKRRRNVSEGTLKKLIFKVNYRNEDHGNKTISSLNSKKYFNTFSSFNNFNEKVSLRNATKHIQSHKYSILKASSLASKLHKNRTHLVNHFKHVCRMLGKSCILNIPYAQQLKKLFNRLKYVFQTAVSARKSGEKMINVIKGVDSRMQHLERIIMHLTNEKVSLNNIPSKIDSTRSSQNFNSSISSKIYLALKNLSSKHNGTIKGILQTVQHLEEAFKVYEKDEHVIKCKSTSTILEQITISNAVEKRYIHYENMNSMETCVEKCCESKHCNTALFEKRICYAIDCKHEECSLTHDPRINSSVALVKKETLAELRFVSSSSSFGDNCEIKPHVISNLVIGKNGLHGNVTLYENVSDTWLCGMQCCRVRNCNVAMIQYGKCYIVSCLSDGPCFHFEALHGEKTILVFVKRSASTILHASRNIRLDKFNDDVSYAYLYENIAPQTISAMLRLTSRKKESAVLSSSQSNSPSFISMTNMVIKANKTNSKYNLETFKEQHSTHPSQSIHSKSKINSEILKENAASIQPINFSKSHQNISLYKIVLKMRNLSLEQGNLRNILHNLNYIKNDSSQNVTNDKNLTKNNFIKVVSSIYDPWTVPKHFQMYKKSQNIATPKLKESPTAVITTPAMNNWTMAKSSNNVSVISSAVVNKSAYFKKYMAEEVVEALFRSGISPLSKEKIRGLMHEQYSLNERMRYLESIINIKDQPVSSIYQMKISNALLATSMSLNKNKRHNFKRLGSMIATQKHVPLGTMYSVDSSSLHFNATLLSRDSKWISSGDVENFSAYSNYHLDVKSMITKHEPNEFSSVRWSKHSESYSKIFYTIANANEDHNHLIPMDSTTTKGNHKSFTIYPFKTASYYRRFKGQIMSYAPPYYSTRIIDEENKLLHLESSIVKPVNLPSISINTLIKSLSDKSNEFIYVPDDGDYVLQNLRSIVQLDLRRHARKIISTSSTYRVSPSSYSHITEIKDDMIKIYDTNRLYEKTITDLKDALESRINENTVITWSSISLSIPALESLKNTRAFIPQVEKLKRYFQALSNVNQGLKISHYLNENYNEPKNSNVQTQIGEHLVQLNEVIQQRPNKPFKIKKRAKVKINSDSLTHNKVRKARVKIASEHNIQSRKSRKRGSCVKSHPSLNMIPKNFGLRKYFGIVNSVEKCVNFCCKWNGCNLAFMVFNECFGVLCKNQCDLVPNSDAKFVTKIVYVKRHKDIMQWLDTKNEAHELSASFAKILYNKNILNKSAKAPPRKLLFITSDKLQQKKEKMEPFKTPVFDKSYHDKNTSKNLIYSKEKRGDSNKPRINVKAAVEPSHSTHIREHCIPGKVEHDVTLIGGIHAGIYTEQGEVLNMNECIEWCCKRIKCDVAMLIKGICYTVSCFNLQNCASAPVRRIQYHPSLVHIRRIKHSPQRIYFDNDKDVSLEEILEGSHPAMVEYKHLGDEEKNDRKNSLIENELVDLLTEQSLVTHDKVLEPTKTEDFLKPSSSIQSMNDVSDDRNVEPNQAFRRHTGLLNEVDPPSCLHYPISYNVTLRHGLRSGYLKTRGGSTIFKTAFAIVARSTNVTWYTYCVTIAF